MRMVSKEKDWMRNVRDSFPLTRACIYMYIECLLTSDTNGRGNLKNKQKTWKTSFLYT